MSSELRVTTTSADVTIGDLGGRTFVHPTVDLDISPEFTEEEIRRSADLQTEVTAGNITLKDELGNVIPIVSEASAHLHRVVDVTDFQAGVSANPDVTANTAATHSHANKSELDQVTDGDHDVRTDNPHATTAAQVGAATTIHTHVAADITNFAAAVSGHVDVSANTTARHTHANKSELDQVTDGDHDVRTDNPHAVTAVQAGAAATIHTHVAADVTDFQAAVSLNADVAANTTARHSHANIVELDQVTDGDHDVRVDNPHAVTIAQIGAAATVHTHVLADITDSGALAALDTVSTGVIDDNAVTNAKLADMAQALIKGRAAGAGTGDPQDLTADQIRTILGVVIHGADNADVYDTTKQDIAMADTFQPLLFSTNQALSGWTHVVNTNTFTCPTTGSYEASIIVVVGKTGGGASDVQLRALFNGVEIPMSVAGIAISNNNSPQQLGSTFPFNGVAAQDLTVEIAGATTSVDAPILPTNVGGSTALPSAIMKIRRVA